MGTLFLFINYKVNSLLLILYFVVNLLLSTFYR